MAEPAFSVCVYCGSRPGDNPAYTQVAQAVGQWIGAHHGQLVYGGGRSGLMGTVAEATRLAGGRVVGVIPQALVDKELATRQCDELHIPEGPLRVRGATLQFAFTRSRRCRITGHMHATSADALAATAIPRTRHTTSATAKHAACHESRK